MQSRKWDSEEIKRSLSLGNVWLELWFEMGPIQPLSFSPQKCKHCSALESSLWDWAAHMDHPWEFLGLSGAEGRGGCSSRLPHAPITVWELLGAASFMIQQWGQGKGVFTVKWHRCTWTYRTSPLLSESESFFFAVRKWGRSLSQEWADKCCLCPGVSLGDRSRVWGCSQQGQCGHSPWVCSPLQEHWSETMGQGGEDRRRVQDRKGESRERGRRKGGKDGKREDRKDVTSCAKGMRWLGKQARKGEESREGGHGKVSFPCCVGSLHQFETVLPACPCWGVASSTL